MSKIIAVMTVWGGSPFTEPVIKQNLDFCDEYIIGVGCHHESLVKHADNTLEICNHYDSTNEKIKTFNLNTNIPNIPYNQWRPQALNFLLSQSQNFEEGNWVFLVDTDEFLFEKDLQFIKQNILTNDKLTDVWIYDKFFFINMHYYTSGCGNYRLFKIKDKRHNKFIPTNKWQGGPRQAHYVPAESTLCINEAEGIFHYSLLCNPYQKIDYWKTEYGHNQAYKTNWIQNTYLKADIKNINDLTTNSVPRKGEAIKFQGTHPESIEEAGLPGVEDFRNLFKP